MIGCGSAPAYLNRIGRRLDVFVPLGGDLGQVPFDRPKVNLRSLQSLVLYPLAQRAGIRASRVVLAASSPEYFDPALRRLGYQGRRIIESPPVIDTSYYAPENVVQYRDRSHWYPHVRALRERTDVMVTSHGRHLWKADRGQRRMAEGNPRFSKRNDLLIHGVASAKRRFPGLRIGVVLYEYGPDYTATIALAEEAGIAEDVLWLPKSARKDIMVNLSLTDLACGELGPHSWLMIGTAAEALAMGKPMFHRRDDSLFRGLYPDLYPRMDVTHADDIASGILAFAEDPARHREMGRQGREWLVKYVTDRGILALERLVEEQRHPTRSVASRTSP